MSGPASSAVSPCGPQEVAVIHEIINQSAMAYKGVIPDDQWHEPYMPLAELKAEMARGVRFCGCREAGRLVAVMGLEVVRDVALIRHAYVRPEYRRHGLGGVLLEAWRKSTERPILIGTWKAATWAVRFYEKHGFAVTDDDERKRLLDAYWPAVPQRQKDVAVVLVDARWRSLHRR